MADLIEMYVDIEDNQMVQGRMCLYSCRGDIYEALCDVNTALAERNIDLQFINVLKGSSDYGIVAVTAKELRDLKVTSEMLEPNWGDIEGKGDWKYHVPAAIRELWDTFTSEQILALCETYKSEADEATRVVDLLASD